MLLAFGWLFATPAQATPLVTDSQIQFSYTWGSVTRTYADAIVTVTVTNDVTNKIGYGGEVIDTYRITFGDQVIEVTEKHGPRDYVFTFTGSQTITLEGIDNGYWAGHYGPIMSVSVSPIIPPQEPVTQSPQSEAPTISDALSQSPPAETQTQTTESPTLAPEVVEPLPTPQPLPQPIPTQTLEPAPIPEPSQPEPTQTPEPLETPTASSETQSPTPEPTPTQTTSEPVPAMPTTSATPPIPVTPIIEPTPIQSSEVTYAEPITESPPASQVAEETKSESVSSTIQATVAQAIGNAVEAVGQLVETFATAGLDMTPEEREKAQDVVVSTVMASQVAAGIRRIK